MKGVAHSRAAKRIKKRCIIIIKRSYPKRMRKMGRVKRAAVAKNSQRMKLQNDFGSLPQAPASMQVEDNLLSGTIEDDGSSGREEQVAPTTNNDVQVGSSGAPNTADILSRDENDRRYLAAEALLQLRNSKEDNNGWLVVGRQDGQPETAVQHAAAASEPPSQPVAEQCMEHDPEGRNNSLKEEYDMLLYEIDRQLMLNGQLGYHRINDYVDTLLAKENVENMDSDSLRALIENKQREFQEIMGYRINFPKPDPVYPSHLHEMILEGNVEMVRELVEQRADVHARGSKGQTPLHLTLWADGNKFLDMVRILVGRGAELDAPGTLNKTLLLMAAENGKSREDLEGLFNLGANFKATDGAGDTILHYLARSGDFQSLEFFVFLGVPADQRNRCNNTAMHAIYCKDNFIQTVYVLMEFGGDVHAFGADRRNVYWFAVREIMQNKSRFLLPLVLKRARRYWRWQKMILASASTISTRAT